jgi:hypothetical protein
VSRDILPQNVLHHLKEAMITSFMQAVDASQASSFERTLGELAGELAFMVSAGGYESLVWERRPECQGMIHTFVSF